MANDKTATVRLKTAAAMIESVRDELPMLFALKNSAELVTIREAMAAIVESVRPLNEQAESHSVVGTFDLLMSMSPTWGPDVAKVGRVIPKRTYTAKPKTTAPAETPAEETPAAETVAEEVPAETATA
jgi:hypothetical protein